MFSHRLENQGPKAPIQIRLIAANLNKLINKQNTCSTSYQEHEVVSDSSQFPPDDDGKPAVYFPLEPTGIDAKLV
jgi:hypothetical protein